MGDFAEAGMVWTIVCLLALVRFVIKHWRGIGALMLAYVIYSYLMMAFHYLASLL
jgi:hypothetical protein